MQSNCQLIIDLFLRCITSLPLYFALIHIARVYNRESERIVATVYYQNCIDCDVDEIKSFLAQFSFTNPFARVALFSQLFRGTGPEGSTRMGNAISCKTVTDNRVIFLPCFLARFKAEEIKRTPIRFYPQIREPRQSLAGGCIRA